MKIEKNLKYKVISGILLGLLLVIPISAKSMQYDIDMDLHCMAQNIYFEAGNQPLAGKVAVANVVMNRVDDVKFPDSICGVVYQTKEWKTSWLTGELIPMRGMCQFSWFCDGKGDKPKDSKTWAESLEIADDVMNGKYFDITEGALWYHANYSNPYWNKHLNQTVRVSSHIFYK